MPLHVPRWLRAAPLASALLASACSSSDAPPAIASAPALPFPSPFLFGTAVAGFQVDMGCPTLPASECEDHGSDWWDFTTSPTTVGDPATHLSGDSPSLGPGEWELYEKDADLLAHDLAGNAMRLSIEWSRIFPAPTDAATTDADLRALASPAAVAHYHALFAALRARAITPLVTLNHYALPSWIHDAVGCHVDLDHCSPRGWVDRERTVREIAKYAGFCAREFGAEVDLWATLNEPFAVALPGYLLPTADRSNPPAVSLRFAELKTVIVALIEAHARMYDAVHANDAVDADGDGKSAEVGVVFPIAPFEPADPSNPLDVEGAKNGFYLYDMVYLNGVAKGDLDANLDGHPVHRDDLAGRMDWMGVNQYARVIVKGLAEPLLPALSPLSTFDALGMKQEFDHARGMYETAMIVKGLGLPEIVTENGTADPNDDGTVPEYLVRNLTWLSRAIRDGADVRGYFYWTLMDNYEWNHGMGRWRGGLFAVEPTDPTRERRPRKGVATFRAIAEAHGVPDDLAERYPEPDR